MSQMSMLRQKLGGYELVGISNFKDVSWMSQWEIENIGGIAYSYWDYKTKSGKTVRKVVKGHWNLSDAQTLSEAQLKGIIKVMKPVFAETTGYKEESEQVKVLQEVINIIKEKK